jgi:aldose 1-epimerase
VLEVTPDRLSPVTLRDVADYEPARFDWREPRVLGAAEIDHAYTALARDARRARRLSAHRPVGHGRRDGVGRCLPVGADPHGGPSRRGGTAVPPRLAVEPMTCAPDAFNADRYDFDAGLIVLDAGASTEASWRITAL